MRLCAPYRGADAHSVRVEFSGYALARDDLHISRLTPLRKSESPFALPMCYRELLAHNREGSHLISISANQLRRRKPFLLWPHC